LEGKGPTPKAEDRVYHKSYQSKPPLNRDRSGGARSSSHDQSGGYRSSGRDPSGGSRSNGRNHRGGFSHSAGATGRTKATAEWVVGRNPVLEALQASLPVQAIYLAEGVERDDRLAAVLRLAAGRSLPLLQASRWELDRLTAGAVHQGVALKLPPFEYADPDDLLDQTLASGGLVVACDQVTDPHNLGAIIRAAAGFAANGVLIPARRSAQLTAAAWKASAGAAARLTVARAGNLNQALATFAKAGCTIIGLAGQAEATIDDLPVPSDGPLTLVVGSEGAGLSRLVRERCDCLARIPTSDRIESLNASVAVGVALYALRDRAKSER